MNWITRGLASLMVAAVVLAPGTALAEEGDAPLADESLTAVSIQELDAATVAKEQIYSAAEKGAPLLVSESGTVSVGIAAGFGYHTVPVTNFAQETSYYCGPASARQSLSFHRAKSGSTASLPTQRTLAGRIGTTTSGSTTTGIARALNSYSSVFGGMGYVASNLTNAINATTTFYTRIGCMLEGQVTAPVILTATARIPRYNGHASRHYITVSGIDDRAATVKMRSVDPNWSSQYRGIYWDAMGSKTVNGLCRACYQADVDGANMAMAW